MKWCWGAFFSRNVWIHVALNPFQSFGCQAATFRQWRRDRMKLLRQHQQRLQQRLRAWEAQQKRLQEMQEVKEKGKLLQGADVADTLDVDISRGLSSTKRPKFSKRSAEGFFTMGRPTTSGTTKSSSQAGGDGHSTVVLEVIHLYPTTRPK